YQRLASIPKGLAASFWVRPNKTCQIRPTSGCCRLHLVSPAIGRIMKTDVPRPIRLKDYTPPDYLIDKVGLDFALDPTRTRVFSRLEMRPNPAAKKKGQPLSLDGENLELGEVRLDGKVLEASAYEVTDRHLILPRVPRKPFTLEIETFINPEANKALQGLYRSRGIYCTQCEAQGFRRITYFLDRPDVLAVYTTRIEANAE